MTHVCLFLFSQRNFRRKIWNKVSLLSSYETATSEQGDLVWRATDSLFWMYFPMVPHRCETCKYDPCSSRRDRTVSACLFSCWLRERKREVMFSRNDYRCTESPARVHITNVKPRPRWIGSKLFSAAPPSPNTHSQHAELSARNLS